MTAAELHDIVGSEPKPWWPDGVHWRFSRVWHLSIDGDAEWPCNPAHAEGLFIGSMVRWLIERSMEHPEIWSEVAENSITRFRVTCSIGWDHIDRSGPTLLHALHAACLAAGEEERK